MPGYSHATGKEFDNWDDLHDCLMPFSYWNDLNYQKPNITPTSGFLNKL